MNQSTSLHSSVIALSMAAASVMLGFGLFGPFLPLYAELLGATVGLQIGLITSSFMFTRAAAAMPSGALSDRIGRKRMITAGLLTYSLATLGYILATDWVQLMVLRGVQGAAAGMFWPVAAALIADIIPPGERGSALGLFNASTAAGMVGGPALGGAIQAYGANILGFSVVDSFRLPFYFGSAFGLLSAFLALKFVKEPTRDPVQRQTLEKHSNDVTYPPNFRKTMYGIAAFSFGHGFSFAFIQPILVYVVHKEYGLNMSETTAYMAVTFFVAGLASILVQYPSGRIADRWPRKPVMIFSGLTAQVCTVLIPFSPNVTGIILLMGLRHIFTGLYLPSNLSMQEDISPRIVRGRLTGMIDTTRYTGSIIAPIVAFTLYDSLGYIAPFLFSAALFTVTLIFFATLVVEPSREEAEI